MFNLGEQTSLAEIGKRWPPTDHHPFWKTKVFPTALRVYKTVYTHHEIYIYL